MFSIAKQIKTNKSCITVLQHRQKVGAANKSDNYVIQIKHHFELPLSFAGIFAPACLFLTQWRALSMPKFPRRVFSFEHLFELRRWHFRGIGTGVWEGVGCAKYVASKAFPQGNTGASQAAILPTLESWIPSSSL